MTEMLLGSKEVEPDPYFHYNHFKEVPERLGFPGDIEIRDENNPDFVLLLTDFGPQVSRTRQQLDEWIARRPDIQDMFCDRIPESDVHATIHRFTLMQAMVESMQRQLVATLPEAIADIEPIHAWYGEKWVVGDAVISELTSHKGDSIRSLAAKIDEAAVDSGFEERDGIFVPHSSDRYAKDLDKSRSEEIEDYLHEGVRRGEIEPVEILLPKLDIALNWPVYDKPSNVGTYKYKTIMAIPFVER